MTSADSSQFTIAETALLHRTGISAFELKKWRGKTVRGEHWERAHAGRYLWSESGVARLLALLHPLPETAPAAVLEKMPPSETLTVVRARTTRVLHVIREGQIHDPTHPLCLWLPQPRGRLFLPGIKVLGRLRSGREDLFDFEGNPAAPEKGRRFPRRIGTW